MYFFFQVINKHKQYLRIYSIIVKIYSLKQYNFFLILTFSEVLIEPSPSWSRVVSEGLCIGAGLLAGSRTLGKRRWLCSQLETDTG